MNPLRRRLNERSGALADLLATHPPIERRIALLYRMAGITHPEISVQGFKGQTFKRFGNAERLQVLKLSAMRS